MNVFAAVRRMSLALGTLMLALVVASVFSPISRASTASLPAGIPSAGSEASVQRVVDGNTVLIDFGGGNVQEVLLAGVDAPNQGECYFDDAKFNLADLLPVGTIVYLEASGTADKEAGTAVRYVWLPSSTGGKASLVNTKLVREGDAAFDNSLDAPKYFDRLEVAQQTAQNKGAGLWSACGDVHAESSPAEATAATDGGVYIDWLSGQSNDITNSLNDLTTLMSAADPTSQDWLNSMAAVTAVWTNAYTNAQSITVPDQYADLNTVWVRAMQHYSAAGDLFNTGLTTGDSSSISAGASELTTGNQYLMVAMAVMTQFVIAG